MKKQEYIVLETLVRQLMERNAGLDELAFHLNDDEVLQQTVAAALNLKLLQAVRTLTSVGMTFTFTALAINMFLFADFDSEEIFMVNKIDDEKSNAIATGDYYKAMQYL